jgi:hypothetical protein
MKHFISKLLPLYLIVALSAGTVNYSQAQNMEFNTDDLHNAEFYDYIYRGHFENIKMERDDLEFLQIFDQYLRACGRQCGDYLPADKVEIMNLECARENVTVTKNGWGVEISRSSYCVEWEYVGSGLYARPDLYNAYQEVLRLHDAKVLREALELLSDPNLMGNTVDKAHKAKALLSDMSQIFRLNSCNGQGIRRFEENLKLFALNKPSIRMKGMSKYAAMKESGGPTGSQDFTRLIDDLVADQGKTWMFNQYIKGSISNVTILTQDNQGRPSRIKANYLYSGFSGKSKGWVKVTFNNGLPNGIYFFDFPNNRKKPGSSIVASYAQGKYGK